MNKKYRYHVVVFFSDNNERLIHSFNSGYETLPMSEIRDELERLGYIDKGNFSVENICKTIND